MFGQASLAEGGQLEDPGAFSARLNKLLLELASSVFSRRGVEPWRGSASPSHLFQGLDAQQFQALAQRFRR